MSDRLSVDDIVEAFQRNQDQLLKDLSNQLKRGAEGIKAGDTALAEQWKLNQIRYLQEFARKNKEIYGEAYKELNRQAQAFIKQEYEQGKTSQERKIASAIKQGYEATRPSTYTRLKLSQINQRKLSAITRAAMNDLTRAEYATLRMVNDQYKKIIYATQVEFANGSVDLFTAIDHSTHDFIANGITSIEYSNGARVNIASYSEMYLRTADKRAYVQGEAAMRDDWGVDLVVVSSHGSGCPICTRWEGEVLVDDVYGNGKPDGKHATLSEAMADGLYHPNCKDTHTTYFEGITKPQKATKAEQKAAERGYQLQQKQRYNERQIRSYKRLRDTAASPDMQEKYSGKVREWQGKQREFIKANNLHREYPREVDRITKNS